MTQHKDEYFMYRALDQAHQGLALGEVPVGAVVVNAQNEIIGCGFNQPIQHHDPSAHAEIMALRDAAGHQQNYRLNGCRLFVTLEPCTMCAGAIIHARIAEVIYGAKEPKTGVHASICNLFDQPWYPHKVVVRGGVLKGRCRQLLQRFFNAQRQSGDHPQH
ncbi:tRNA-specific adenosine deaminase [Terasakiispira papahanaumokuakeensis]|uniref:tRNA-specific adenosine deaminase n=1 Tax=Terasakiispira papahanaumokuakeensis TaxID=197479 RepID=A0A1E2V6F6_9GAMM|nr:tRNA adenosine(34) deaminase TadA [Terasakiispira papahanaumokuakeensis]ODC02245.1 tRNA-specific adenosine deaminase [Terasakiispira papahanaumokuakeensis]